MAAQEGFYKITAGLEAAVAYYLVTDRKFGADLLTHIKPKGFADESVRLLVDAARRVYDRTGAPPASARIVYTQIETMIDNGQVTRKQLRAAKDVIVRMCDQPPQEASEDIADVLVGKLKRHAQQEALDQMSKDFVRGTDMGIGLAKMDKAEGIGKADTTIGTRVRSDLVGAIRAVQKLKRSPTGIPELDLEISGGLREKSIGCYVGAPGSGKSMALLQSLCANAARGVVCGLATIGELSWEEQYVRAIAHMTGIATHEMEYDDDAAEDAAAILEDIVNLKQFGMITIKEFPDGVHVRDIKTWLESERQAGLEVQALYVDYADKMGWKGTEGGYEGMKLVYSGLRELARVGDLAQHLKWVWTASQGTKDMLSAKGAGGMQHASDSMWKARIVDLMITVAIAPDSEGELINYGVVKNRHGKSEFVVDELPQDWERARQCTPSWPRYWPV